MGPPLHQVDTCRESSKPAKENPTQRDSCASKKTDERRMRAAGPCAGDTHRDDGAEYETCLNPFPRKNAMAKLSKPSRDRIPTTKFAFPKQRKEPLENASHVRNAAARFDQVQGVTQAERSAAWKRIKSAAKRYGVELKESA
jgi:hypothetical protein